jgi:hypothetical protein
LDRYDDKEIRRLTKGPGNLTVVIPTFVGVVGDD